MMTVEVWCERAIIWKAASVCSEELSLVMQSPCKWTVTKYVI